MGSLVICVIFYGINIFQRTCWSNSVCGYLLFSDIHEGMANIIGEQVFYYIFWVLQCKHNKSLDFPFSLLKECILRRQYNVIDLSLSDPHCQITTHPPVISALEIFLLNLLILKEMLWKILIFGERREYHTTKLNEPAYSCSARF